MNYLVKAAVIGMSVLALQSVTNAAHLTGVAKDNPDILADTVGIYYTATSDTLTVRSGAPTLQVSSSLVYNNDSDWYVLDARSTTPAMPRLAH